MHPAKGIQVRVVVQTARGSLMEVTFIPFCAMPCRDARSNHGLYHFLGENRVVGFHQPIPWGFGAHTLE